MMKDRKESCVELNIYAECDECTQYEPKAVSDSSNKNDDDETCVRINVFVECDKKKRRYTL